MFRRLLDPKNNSKSFFRRQLLRPILVVFLVGGFLTTSYSNCTKQFRVDKQLSVAELASQNNYGPGGGGSGGNGTGGGTSDNSKIPALNSLPSKEHITSHNTVYFNADGSESPNGQNRDDCMTSGEADACVVWKSPATVKGSPYVDWFQMGTDLRAIQTFGVKLFARTNLQSLTSRSIKVLWIDPSSPRTSTSVTATSMALDSQGRMKIPYASENSSPNQKYAMAQVNTYFWLTQLESEVRRRTRATDPAFAGFTAAQSGVFYANQVVTPMPIYGYFNNSISSLAYNNAYFTPVKGGERVVIGYAAKDSTLPGHELGINADVSIHEYGHANFFFARNRVTITDGSSEQNGIYYCADYKGCVDGMDEGIADFHMMMLFPDSPTVGDTFLPGRVLRDSRRFYGINVETSYNSLKTGSAQIKGEVHSAGEVYASLLLEIYNDPELDKRVFETTFMLHLQTLTNTSNFISSKNSLLSIDKEFFHARNSAIISRVFESRGLLN